MSSNGLQVQHVPRFRLESGRVLKNLRQAYHMTGSLNERRDNLVLVFHSLTSDSNVAGDWWSDAIGPGKSIDTNRFAVLCTNLIGSCYGSTGPWERERRPFPRVTTRDMARFAQLLLDHMGVRSVALVTGGSLGGMVALEWLASFPALARSAVIFAAPAAHSAQAMAWNHVQRCAIRLGGSEGLALARMVGMITYRTPLEFQQRFGRRQNEAGDYLVETYLDHHGQKLVQRFDLHSYVTLTHAMDSHDVGRGRGGIAAALAPVEAHVVGVGIPGDVLYPAGEVQEWVREAGGQYRIIDSVHGHDGFLTQAAQAGAILRDALASIAPARVA